MFLGNEATRRHGYGEDLAHFATHVIGMLGDVFSRGVLGHSIIFHLPAT